MFLRHRLPGLTTICISHSSSLRSLMAVLIPTTRKVVPPYVCFASSAFRVEAQGRKEDRKHEKSQSRKIIIQRAPARPARRRLTTRALQRIREHHISKCKNELGGQRLGHDARCVDPEGCVRLVKGGSIRAGRIESENTAYGIRHMARGPRSIWRLMHKTNVCPVKHRAPLQKARGGNEGSADVFAAPFRARRACFHPHSSIRRAELWYTDLGIVGKDQPQRFPPPGGKRSRQLPCEGPVRVQRLLRVLGFEKKSQHRRAGSGRTGGGRVRGLPSPPLRMSDARPFFRRVGGTRLRAGAKVGDNRPRELQRHTAVYFLAALRLPFRAIFALLLSTLLPARAASSSRQRQLVRQRRTLG